MIYIKSIIKIPMESSEGILIYLRESVLRHGDASVNFNVQKVMNPLSRSGDRSSTCYIIRTGSRTKTLVLLSFLDLSLYGLKIQNKNSLVIGY